MIPGAPIRWCDKCTERFIPELQAHLRCLVCGDYDICGSGMSKATETKDGTIVGHACGKYPDYIYLDPEQMPEEWTDRQAGLLKGHVEALAEQEEREKAEAEAAALKAEEERKKEEEAQRQSALLAARKPVPITSSTAPPRLNIPASVPRQRAPSPSPRPASRLAPPPQQPRQHKSSTQLGLSLLKGALAVKGAVLNAENAANGGFGGGGGVVVNSFGSDGGAVGMDMSSFWAPINAAASAPIQ